MDKALHLTSLVSRLVHGHHLPAQLQILAINRSGILSHNTSYHVCSIQDLVRIHPAHPNLARRAFTIASHLPAMPIQATLDGNFQELDFRLKV